MKSQEDEYLSITKRPPEAVLKRLILDAAGKEHGTPHGLMLLRGQLNKRQYAACNWFEALYEKYLAAIGRARGLRTSTGERYDRGHDPDGDSVAGIEMAAHEASSVAEYNSARLVALGVGRDEFRQFWSIIIEDSLATSRGKDAVAKVASALERHRSRGWKSRRSGK